MAGLSATWLRSRPAVLDNFWLVPGLTAAALALLAIVLVALDRRSGSDGFAFAYQGGPGAARDLLSVLAGSVITVAGLIFSIMIVTLQLVAAQYTPRALRTFFADRMTQLVAGAFVGVFAYSLLVLRTIRGDGEVGGAAEFVPSLSITVGILLGLVALVLLIAFVNHMSRSIQISNITARIARDTSGSVETLYPGRQGDDSGDDVKATLAAWRAQTEGATVAARASGFVQAVALEPLAAAASRHRWHLHVVAKPGDFVTSRTAVLEVWPAAAAVEQELADAVEDAFSLAQERDLRQDALFGLRQLGDIAVRALSPGVNDPTTAVTCLRHTQEVLERLAAAAFPDRLRRFDSTVVVAERPSFREALEPLIEIAAFAGGQPLVANVVLDVLHAVGRAAAEAGHADRVQVLAETAERVVTPLLDAAATSEAREDLSRRRALILALGR